MNALHPDLIQAPLNIFDQRIIRTGWLKRLASEGIEVHVRSIFLQGLLLQEPGDRPVYFDRWTDALAKWDSLVQETGYSRTALCLGFVKQFEQIDRVIVGIDNTGHLRQLVKDFALSVTVAPQNLSVQDASLIDPFNWTI